MNKRIIVTAITACSTFALLFAHEHPVKLVGAWRGPNDLIVNMCDDNQMQPYVCYCGIFRAYGWSDFSTVVAGDSLIMKSTGAESPFEGRFKIESDDRLVGSLTMGYPDAAWYYNGCAELIRQKPEMPDNLNADLEGTILPSDYGRLSVNREAAREVLSTLSPDSYGYAEREDVWQLLDAKTYPVTPDEMMGFKRVRSIQIAANDGIFSYPYFNCRFRKVDGKVFFEKTSGSQRKSGYVYQNTPESLVFLGGWSVNNEPQTSYGSENSVAGMVYKIGPGRAIMIFSSEDNRVEIYEFIK